MELRVVGFRLEMHRGTVRSHSGCKGCMPSSSSSLDLKDLLAL